MVNLPSGYKILEISAKEVKVEFKKIASKDELAKGLISKLSRLYGHWDWGGCQVFFDKIDPSSVSGDFILSFPDYDEIRFIRVIKESYAKLKESGKWDQMWEEHSKRFLEHEKKVSGKISRVKFIGPQRSPEK
ncbi:MAG: hypothetical protein QHH14_12170 [Clostridiales bacterium]|jgi:hypothetical protein|nr:hypothetical protein [Clostridiales bacterium]